MEDSCNSELAAYETPKPGTFKARDAVPTPTFSISSLDSAESPTSSPVQLASSTLYSAKV